MMKLGRKAGWLVVILLLAGGAVYAGWRDYVAPGPLVAAKTVVIEKGSGLREIAKTLGHAGILAHPWIFVAGTYLMGRSHALHAGEYEFAARISPAGAADLLESGTVVEHRFTLPEGLTSAQAVALLDAAPALSGKIDVDPPEGTLFPNTYFYTLGTTRNELIDRMHRAMTRALAAAWASRAPDLPLESPAQALILASIVEKETAKPEERARVAGVYIERLKIGMRLQADPTVIYAITNGGAVPLVHPLDHQDLSFPSPYNTYLENGLPPTPIDSPGRASLDAALHPDVDGDLYFVADGNGGHLFSKTLEQQNRNVAKLRSEQGGG